MRITLKELERLKISWFDVCQVTGGDEWAVNEGMIDEDSEIEINLDEAYRIGVITQDPLPE